MKTRHLIQRRRILLTMLTTLSFGYPAGPYFEAMRAMIREVVTTLTPAPREQANDAVKKALADR